MNKKGQGLPMNTVVMAILVIVVLILVLTFFFGGFTGLSMKIRQIFFGSLAGTGKTLAIQNCNQYCDQLQWADASAEQAKIDSQFCKPRAIDLDEDGQISEDEKNIHCQHSKLGVSCNYVRKDGDPVTVTC